MAPSPARLRRAYLTLGSQSGGHTVCMTLLFVSRASCDIDMQARLTVVCMESESTTFCT